MSNLNPPFLSRASVSVLLGFICKLAEGALNPTLSLIKMLMALVPLWTIERNHTLLVSTWTLSHQL